MQYEEAAGWRWLLKLEEVQFHIWQGDRKTLCRVTREFIEDHCGDPRTSRDCLAAAKNSYDRITDRAGRMLGAGIVEPDGSVLIRTF